MDPNEPLRAKTDEAGPKLSRPYSRDCQDVGKRGLRHPKKSAQKTGQKTSVQNIFAKYPHQNSGQEEPCKESGKNICAKYHAKTTCKANPCKWFPHSENGKGWGHKRGDLKTP